MGMTHCLVTTFGNQEIRHLQEKGSLKTNVPDIGNFNAKSCSRFRCRLILLLYLLAFPFLPFFFKFFFLFSFLLYFVSSLLSFSSSSPLILFYSSPHNFRITVSIHIFFHVNNISLCPRAWYNMSEFRLPPPRS